MTHIDNELTYLINPQYQNQIHYNKGNDDKEISKEELKFYRKRILQSTRDLLDDVNIYPVSNSMLKESFLLYALSCINYYKAIDTTDIIQHQYDTLNNNKIIDNSNNYIDNNNNGDISENNQLLFKQRKSINTIEECMNITKIRDDSNVEVFPIKKKVDLRDPSLKIKGVKKKSVSIITNIDDKNEKKDLENESKTKKDKKNKNKKE